MDTGEVLFLALSFLDGGPCQEAVDLLARQAHEKGLLPSRTDVFGGWGLGEQGNGQVVCGAMGSCCAGQQRKQLAVYAISTNIESRMLRLGTWDCSLK